MKGGIVFCNEVMRLHERLYKSKGTQENLLHSMPLWKNIYWRNKSHNTNKNKRTFFVDSRHNFIEKNALAKYIDSTNH